MRRSAHLRCSMHVRTSKILPALITIVSLGVAGCDDIDVARGNLTAPGSATSALVSVEPATVTPEFLSGPFCATQPPFRGRVTVIVRSGHERFLRSIQFEFHDRFGGQAFPTPIPIPTPATIPSATPVPIPTSSPIPIPGLVMFGAQQPLVSLGNVPTQSFWLHFGCGSVAAGTLIVAVETTDRF